MVYFMNESIHSQKYRKRKKTEKERHEKQKNVGSRKRSSTENTLYQTAVQTAGLGAGYNFGYF